MNWNDWHKEYGVLPSLQERLRLVQIQIAAAISECPPGAIRVVSMCAGDGRDLIGAVQNHPRRRDISAVLLDTHVESIARGVAAAEQAGLGRQFQFVAADAAQAKNYAGIVPADLVLLSGFLGHLRHADIPGLIGSLPMFCKAGGWVIWSRHLTLNEGREQVPFIRKLFGQTQFEEINFETTAPDGFAIGCERFKGQPSPLEQTRVLFDFVGLDRLSAAMPPAPTGKPDVRNNFASKSQADVVTREEISNSAETTIPARFKEIVARHPLRTALVGGDWELTYAELDALTDTFAGRLISQEGQAGDRVALLMRHDAPLMAATLSVLKAGRTVVVLNPNDPPDRLRHILDDADLRVIIMEAPTESLAKQVALERQLLCFDRNDDMSGVDFEITTQPTDPAWLIYTSGSTGRPKAVIQTHRNIVHNVIRLSRGMEITANDRMILLGSPSSGQGVAVCWCALLNGAALYPFPIAEKGVTRLKEWMLEQKISLYVSSASIFRHFVKILEEGTIFPDMRVVRLGSEAITVEDFDAYRRFFPDKCKFMVTLSSSETGNITQQFFNRDSALAAGRMPVGRPVLGMEILLLNDQGGEVPPGEVGEIAVRSRFLSPGYWRNDALTAERFSSETNGVRLFRSGDLARRMADGTFYFEGRKDTRVKIHGNRIEVSEIEGVLTQQVEVALAAVSVRTTPEGETRLVAHIVPRHQDQNCTAEIFRQRLRQVLPGYMIPAHFIFTDKIPFNAAGKIDHERLAQVALPVPVHSGTAPLTSTEILLAEIWQKVFRREHIGRHDNFFELGGDSLNAAVIAAEIFAALNVELEMRVFSRHPALAELAQAVDASPRITKKAVPDLVRVPRDQPLPLSFTQERVWKDSQSVEGMKCFTMSGLYRLSGPLNVEVFRATLDYLFCRHEILRTTIDEVDGRPVQIINPPGPVPLPLLDFSGHTAAEADAAALLREEKRQVFNFRTGPLLNFKLVRLGVDEHRLLRISHHVISDNVSWKIFFRELALIYEAKLAGRPVLLPEFEPVQYADYAVRERAMLHPENPAFREMVDWWQPVMAPQASPMKMPFSRPQAKPEAKADEGVARWGLDPAVNRRLGELAGQEGATPFAVRLAALGALWSVSGNPELAVATFATGRNCLATQNMFGDFSNVVVLRLRCDPGQTFREWLGVVQKLTTETQARSAIPYALLSEEMRRRGIELPPHEFIFAQTSRDIAQKFGGLTLAWLDQHEVQMPWGFCLGFEPGDTAQRCRLTFDARIYHPARVRKWLDRYERLLGLVSEKPNATISELLAASRKRPWFWFAPIGN